MNVLHMCLSEGFGGLEMYPLRVGREMMQQGHKVYGMSLLDSPIDHAMSQNFQDAFAVKSRGYAIQHVFALAKWVKQRDIDVVHCHKSSDLLLAVMLKKLCHFKLVYTDHMGVKRPKKDFFHRFIYRHVDQVLSISRFTLANNKKALPIADDKIQALWLGTDIPKAPPAFEDMKLKLGLTANTNLVGIVGRLSPGKGHLELIKAFELLKVSEFHLLIVGGETAKEGGNEAYVAMLKDYIAAHDLSSKISFYGFSSTPDTLLGAVDVVVIPSHNEAFGLTVIESMAQGKAIIGSNAGAIPEILENTGVLVDPFDAEILASAIANLCEDDVRRRNLALAARKRAETHFDQVVHVERLLGIYQSL